MKKLERWFYLQLQLMLNMYMRKGNPFFTQEEMNTPRAIKRIIKLDKQNDLEQIRKKNHRYWNKHYNAERGMYI